MKKIRVFVSDPLDGVGFFDEFDLFSFSGGLEDFLLWYTGILSFIDMTLDYYEVI